jgi:hypothetical protein
MLDPKCYLEHYSNISINDPIFLIGNQGDGLTLLSRMLRRNPQVVSVTGNSNYWAGGDEMMNVFEPILTSELSGIFISAPPHKILKPPRSWSYASNALIKRYRKTEKNSDVLNKKKLRSAIGMAIARNGKHIRKPRFIDKSQVFSVKLSFINSLLVDCNPYFIHVTRNPYATIFRAATSAKDMKRYSHYLNFSNRMKMCSQHWLNVAKSIEEDKCKISNFLRIKFEDILEDPKNTLKKVCDVINLQFSEDMIPQPHHRLPFGVRFQKRWYPLRKDVNNRYLEKLSFKDIELIDNICGNYPEKFGYKI